MCFFQMERVGKKPAQSAHRPIRFAFKWLERAGWNSKLAHELAQTGPWLISQADQGRSARSVGRLGQLMGQLGQETGPGRIIENKSNGPVGRLGRFFTYPFYLEKTHIPAGRSERLSIDPERQS